MDHGQNELLRLPVRTRRTLSANTPHLCSQSLGLLLEGLETGILIFKDGKCIYWNLEAETIFAKINFSLCSFLSPTDILRGPLGIEEDLMQAYLYLKQLGIRVDDSVVKMDIEVSLIDVPSSGMTVLLVNDVSELLANREAVRQLDSLLIVGELAAGIAHEIRNPLASIRGFAQMIRSAQDFQTIEVYTDIMVEELDRMNGLVEELLHLARPRSQPRQGTDLVALLDTVVLLLNAQAILKNCSVVFENRGRMMAVPVLCHANRLKQAFINIVKNAVEASPIGSSVKVSVMLSGTDAVVSIEDQGPGMSHNQVISAGRSSFSTKENGTGLGLMISRNIIREHQGTFEIESGIAEGTTVQIRIPVVEVTRVERFSH